MLQWGFLVSLLKLLNIYFDYGGGYQFQYWVILIHYLYEKNILIKKNNLGIPEPLNGNKIKTKLIEVVFVPLIIVDKIGNRVGYGKGYYDRFLNKCDKKVIKVGLSFFDIIEKIEDTTHNDIRLNFCITPKKIIKF